jgi:TonB family protein
LRIERQGQDWRVIWNKELSAASAQGRLSFTDGVTREDLELRTSELKSGMVTYSYSPVNDRGFLRLEITDRDSRTISESARLATDLMPASRPRMPRRTVSQGQRSRSRDGRSTLAKAADAPENPAEQDVAIVRSLLRKPRAEPFFSVPASGLQQGGKFEPAKLIVRRNPIYPARADQSYVSETVEVSFRISPEGKVYNTKWIKGSPLLAQAAAESVESWLYEPARLNGAPIDSQGTATVEFERN